MSAKDKAYKDGYKSGQDDKKIDTSKMTHQQRDAALGGQAQAKKDANNKK